MAAERSVCVAQDVMYEWERHYGGSGRAAAASGGAAAPSLSLAHRIPLAAASVSMALVARSLICLACEGVCVDLCDLLICCV